MKNKIFPALVLTLICFTVTLLLSSVNILTEDRILDVQYKKEQSDLGKIMPEGENFTPIIVDGIPASITTVYSESSGGYVFKISTKGYKTGLIILCGIDSEGNLTGVQSTKTSETPSKEQGIGDLFNGMSLDTQNEIIISGSTKTSKAYSDAVRDAFEAFKIITATEDNSNEKQQ